MKPLVALAALGLGLLAPRVARACAVCSTADPTLVPEGGEAPYEGRVRLGFDARAGHIVVGAGAEERALLDRRLAASGTFSSGRTLVGFIVPMLTRRVALGAASRSLTALGDLQARLDVVLGSRRRARHGLLFELHLPTAPVQQGPDGVDLPAAMQPGCSSLLPVVGAYFVAGSGAFSLSGAASGRLPIAVRAAPHTGPGLRATLDGQLQPHLRLALRLGLDARLEAQGELSPGRPDPNSGGFIGYATGSVVTSPVTDLVLTVGLHVPLVQRFSGVRREEPVVALTAAYDL